VLSLRAADIGEFYMIVTKKNESNSTLVSRLRNEFLFAREFEYESPLTPEELVGALKAIENIQSKAWVLSIAPLTHKLETTVHSDKAIDFKITLHEDKKSAWSSRMNLQFVEGSIHADPVTGLSTITGKTRFSGQYYAIWVFIFAANIFTQVAGTMSWGGWIWAAFAVIFWFAMYQSRNTLADNLDTIIMHAKSERSLAILEGEEDVEEAETVIESQNLMESE
jgi:hypothetical protein